MLYVAVDSNNIILKEGTKVAILLPCTAMVAAIVASRRTREMVASRITSIVRVWTRSTEVVAD